MAEETVEQRVDQLGDLLVDLMGEPKAALLELLKAAHWVDLKGNLKAGK